MNATSMILFALSFMLPHIFAQSNYASQANNIEYAVGLPEEATLDGKVTKLDDLSPIIFLNRTKAALNCAAGSMEVDLKFNEKFYGIAYADFDRNSACQIIGKGDLSYRIELPLKGCGTKQEPQRVFSNNIVVRFHPGLEMDGDEIITIVCRYPPPVAPPPAGFPLPRIVPAKAAILEPPLKGIQILFIICAIMFLTLLLLGLGVSYYCLKRRPIIVRRLPVSLGSGSEITKLSGSSLGNLPVFEGVKIPRAHAPLQQLQSSSGSEGALISDTLPSDYPSESHSEAEEIDTRSIPASSAGSYENRAYVQETSSIYSEHYGHTQEVHAVDVREHSPQFNVQVRVKRAPPPPPSDFSSSDSDSVQTNRMERNNLSTIMESHEDRESILTVESLPQEQFATQFSYVPEIHPIPKYIQSPPVVQKIIKREHSMVKDSWSDDIPPRSVISHGTEMTDTHSITEILDSTHLYSAHRTPVEIEQVEMPEPPISVSKKPEITQHVVDDVFLKTITEKNTVENIQSHKRLVTEYKAHPAPDRKWDVTIRNYPTQSMQWENFSDVSSTNGTATPKMERAQMSLPPRDYISEENANLRSPELVGNMKPVEIPPQDKTVPNWNVLIRVLEEPEMEIPDDTSSVHSSAYLQRQLSYEDKTKWKNIITTESTLRTMLTEATVKEDFERIRSDERYRQIFEPQSWDVIIRILAPPDDVELRSSRRNKKRETWDTRSRRSSLPTLYEYDSDGGSSVRTITNDIVVSQTNQSYQYPPRFRKNSRSSYRSDNIDMRSMTEMTVDFGRPETVSNGSDGSSLYPSRYYDDDGYDRRSSLARSLSQPSLARSASEFTEHWAAPEDIEYASPEGSPHRSRRQFLSTTYQNRERQNDEDQQVVQERYIEQQVTSYQTANQKSKWYQSDRQ